LADATAEHYFWLDQTEQNGADLTDSQAITTKTADDPTGWPGNSGRAK
jgi:hypothetical protein